MLGLQKCILTRLLPHASAATISPLHRLLSAAAAPRISSNPSFAVEDYLVSTCGLTRAQASKASPKISHLKSPSNPDAVLAFLAGLGLSSADLAAVVAKDPKLLCAGVERTLGPVVTGFTVLGLSRSEIARFVSLAPRGFRAAPTVSGVQYYLSLFGSVDNLLRLLKHGSDLFGSDLERVVKPNIMFLRESGLDDCDIVKLCIRVPRILKTTPQRVQGMVACAKALCVPRGSGMLRMALQAVVFWDEDKITMKVEYMKNTLRWSDTEVSIALSKAPMLLRCSKDKLQRTSEFLISEMGLEPGYIAHRPTMLNCRLDGRLIPRYYVVKFLKANGLVHCNRDYYNTVSITEKVFVAKYICPHREVAPHLAEDYAAACRGEVPARLIFS